MAKFVVERDKLVWFVVPLTRVFVRSTIFYRVSHAKCHPSERHAKKYPHWNIRDVVIYIIYVRFPLNMDLGCPGYISNVPIMTISFEEVNRVGS